MGFAHVWADSAWLIEGSFVRHYGSIDKWVPAVEWGGGHLGSCFFIEALWRQGFSKLRLLDQSFAFSTLIIRAGIRFQKQK
jgi:hypothetical protein